jgi:type IV secretion system protein VirB10
MTSGDGTVGAVPTGDTDIRPLVANDPGNRPLWIGVAAIVLIGLMLFYALETRRQAITAPPVRPRVADLATAPTSVPPLYIPPAPVLNPVADRSQQGAPADQQTPRPPVQSPPVSFAPPPDRLFAPNPNILPSPPPVALPPVPQTVAVDTSPAIIFDQTQGDQSSAKSGSPAGQAGPAPAIASRARATRSRPDAMVVPQGTLIAAVLETALDSTQPGQTRALVSRDVPNLAGGPVLIPRGSRLYGEYRGELGAGQKRAMIQWSRLVTPDGISIAIDSPAADQLGRAGIKGKVNSQFAARLGGALLQSVIDVGAFAAVRSLSDSPFFVAVPGAVQGSASPLVGPPPRPTLKVRQGTRISVFVARDLDFSGVGRRK